ncbi:MAG: hypothetical protein HY321_06645 [Armatimonadetes bacterium]|nr:hypothetical protein [Armatimonadota bacterium]
MMRSRDGGSILLLVLVAGLLSSGAGRVAAEGQVLSYNEVVALARAYMDEEDGVRRAEILKKVEGWSERLDEIARALRPVPPADAPTGYLACDRFTVPRIRARMQRLLPILPGPLPEGARAVVRDGRFSAVAENGDILWSRKHPHPAGPIPQLIPRAESDRRTAFRLQRGSPGAAATPDGIPAPAEEYLSWVLVPKDYDATRAYALSIRLHGGGGTNAIDSAALGSETAADRALAALPNNTIQVDLGTPKIAPLKWSFPESEIHIQSVIEEYSTRYHIDPDRVFISGGSMGGIGSWWHAWRHGDRFALIAPVTGTWTAAYWPKLRGTLLYHLSGAYDSRMTRVDWARYGHERMKALGIFHLDGEYPGGHISNSSAGPQTRAIRELMRSARRDPYPPWACAVSPFTPPSSSGYPLYSGTDEEYVQRFSPQPYSFWVSVLEHGPEGIPVERLRTRFGYPQKFTPEREMMKAGAADAENLGGNRFRVYTTNVRRFALWLHPKMGVDFARPVEIEVIERGVDPETLAEVERARHTVRVSAKPSLAAMLKYRGDRRDYGLIYHAAVEVAVGEQ